ncbi:hypothetical protein BC828DRAFT_20808 [Blastocladiella britannica]|nr:hypothetical protein BC828DRAFT_20808 [Blastocladiella britannica]
MRRNRRERSRPTWWRLERCIDWHSIHGLVRVDATREQGNSGRPGSTTSGVNGRTDPPAPSRADIFLGVFLFQCKCMSAAYVSREIKVDVKGHIRGHDGELTSENELPPSPFPSEPFLIIKKLCFVGLPNEEAHGMEIGMVSVAIDVQSKRKTDVPSTLALGASTPVVAVAASAKASLALARSPARLCEMNMERLFTGVVML